VENVETPIETLVGNMLGCVQVPQPGGPQVRFSIGAGDRQALQPPLSPTLPVSKNAVYLLFQELGNLIFYSLTTYSNVYFNVIAVSCEFKM